MIAMKCGGRPIGGAIRIASTFGSRFMGLMFRKSLPEGSGLLIMPCSSIHMCFMRMALDIVYMDANLRVVGVQEALRPWRLGALVKGAKLVLEVPVGTIARCGVRPGAKITVEAPAAAGEPQTIHEKRDCNGYQAAG
jgi:uncharacterized membrane protein (UPF0127 family)